MKRLLFFIILILVELSTTAQTTQSIFEWKSDTEIQTKDIFRPLFEEPNSKPPFDPRYKVYTLNSYTTKNQKGDTYTIKLYSVDDSNPNRNNYDGFSILYQGKNIFTYYTGDPLYNSEFITAGKSKARFLQIPLDEKSFALCFGGWLYGIDDAPELVIVVVSGNRATVVFDNYAYDYKYAPAPNFYIEYVDNIEGLYDQYTPTITAAFLKKRTKHKIWKEGNVLKYKAWK